MNDYRITLTQGNGGRSVSMDYDSDMFHALCRAAEACERTDVKVTVELLKENSDEA